MLVFSSLRCKAMFSYCAYIVCVLSLTLSLFIISAGDPKSYHTNDLNVARVSLILILSDSDIKLAAAEKPFSSFSTIPSSSCGFPTDFFQQ